MSDVDVPVISLLQNFGNDAVEGLCYENAILSPRKKNE